MKFRALPHSQNGLGVTNYYNVTCFSVIDCSAIVGK